jgi:hypothetical protein
MERSAIREAAPPLVRPGLRSAASGLQREKEAERRQAHVSILRTFRCGARTSGCARLSAFHHGSHQGAFAPFAQLQARFPGTWQDARSCMAAPTGGRRPCALTRALPAPACPSPGKAPPAPAVVPAVVMPEAARERMANPRAGTALAPPCGMPSARPPSIERDSSTVTETETHVNENVTCNSFVIAGLASLFPPGVSALVTPVARSAHANPDFVSLNPG